MWVTMPAAPLAEYLIEMAMERDAVEFHGIDPTFFDPSEMAESVSAVRWDVSASVLTIDGEYPEDGWRVVFDPRHPGTSTLVIG